MYKRKLSVTVKKEIHELEGWKLKLNLKTCGVCEISLS